MLDKIIEAVEKQKPTDEKKGGAKSWWRWPLLILLVLVGLAIAAHVLRKDRRELAKLRHEKNKTKILADNMTAEAEAKNEENKVSEALELVRKSKAIIKSIDERVTIAEQQYESKKKDIERITWADLPRAD